MLSKEEREIIKKIGIYQFNKMKELNMNLEEFEQYKKKQKEERKFKQKIGYRKYTELKELGMTLEEYKEFLEKTKYKNRQKREEKNKIRYRTIRYVERYCDLEMKCQICNTTEDVQIHHPNYNDYLKVNFLCIKHHNQLHNFELVPPEIIDLENIAVKKQLQKQKQEYIKSQIQNMKQDILKNGYSYKEIADKYKITEGTIKRHLEKEENWQLIEKKLKEAGKINESVSKMKHKTNPLQKYRIEHNLTIKELSKMTQIPAPTIAKIETGATDINKIKPNTRKKLEKLKEVKINGH